MDIAELRRAAEQVMHQPELFSIVCRLAMVQMQKRGEPQPLLYTACQELREGKSFPCNRRVDSSGFCASCNRAGKAAPRFNLRCRFSDRGDSVWITTFHEAAQQVIGMSSEEAQAVEAGAGGREELEGAVMAAYFTQPLQVTVRAKLDSYNGETRTNITCVDARPVSFRERGRAMLGEPLVPLGVRALHRHRRDLRGGKQLLAQHRRGCFCSLCRGGNAAWGSRMGGHGSVPMIRRSAPVAAPGGRRRRLPAGSGPVAFGVHSVGVTRAGR